jgi:2,4-didehydro-3-deoxy-L-rhamnonate hydrolase
MKGSQWNKGKGAKHFGPLGPYLVPTEEVGDPQTLDIKLTVNGQVRQNSNTSDMLFNVAHLLWYLSQFFVLEPGDIVTTGTPQGVASGMKPPAWLKPGDVVETTLSKLGTQRNTVQASV